MTGFVQIIEIKTSRVDEIQQLVEEMRSSSDTGTALRGTVTKDRDRPGHYLNIVEFESHESAMANSTRPEVTRYAARIAELCDEPPRFYNLDVEETWSAQSSTPTAKAVLAGTAAAAGGLAAAALGKAKGRVQEQRDRRQRAPGNTTTATTTTAADRPSGAGTGPDVVTSRSEDAHLHVAGEASAGTDGGSPSDPRP